MNIDTIIMLHMIDLYKGQRSLNGMLHLLNGKRSTQTIQDGHLFQSLSYFGVWPKKDVTMIKPIINHLIDWNFIKELDNKQIITSYGKEGLKKGLEHFFFLRWLNGWKYKDATKLFWLRLLLLTQTLSFTTINQNHFYPITHDYQTIQWIKKHFPKEFVARKSLAKQLYEELYHFLDPLPEPFADLFVSKLSGFHKIGLTNEQICETFHLAKEQVDLMLLAMLHRLLTVIENERNRYHVLFFMASDLLSQFHLTKSAQKTYDLWKKGYTIEEIAKYRSLKVSTIEDHFIEIVIADPFFPIDQFVSAELFEQIKQAVKAVGTTKLRPIKEKLAEDVRYFQIRIVLTRLGGNDDRFTS